MFNTPAWLRHLFNPPTPPIRKGFHPSLEALEERVLLSGGADLFLHAVYRDALGRSPDDSGLRHWAARLQDGVTPVRVVQEIVNSPERQGLALEQQYATFLHRSADPQGHLAFTRQLAAGVPLERVQAEILGSGEYFAHRAGGTNQGFLGALYHDVFSRPVDPSGAAVFGRALEQGVPREAVAETVVTSPEARRGVLDKYYQQYLQRRPDQFGEQAWMSAMGHGDTGDQVLAGFLGSAEYQNRLAQPDESSAPAAAAPAVPHPSDGNGLSGDGLSDVATIRDMSGDMVTLAAPGHRLRDVSVHEAPAAATSAGRFPWGLFTFTVLDVAPGGSVNVTLTLPSGANPSAYAKLDPATGRVSAFGFDGSTGVEFHDNVAIVHLLDGGRGDADGLPNGHIVDPIGPLINGGIPLPGDSPPIADD